MSMDGAAAAQPAAEPLSERYREVRAATEALAAPLSAEDACIQSMPDVSPSKWHLAHASWFWETFLLGPHSPGYRRFDERFGHLSLGGLMQVRQIEHLCAEGVVTYDLGIDLDYKHRWADEPRDTLTLVVVRGA